MKLSEQFSVSGIDLETENLHPAARRLSERCEAELIKDGADDAELQFREQAGRRLIYVPISAPAQLSDFIQLNYYPKVGKNMLI